MKKLLILSFLLMISISFVLGQESNLKLIENGKYPKAAKKITAGLAKKPDDVILNYSMAILLIQREYKEYNTKQAYDYIIKTKAYLAKVTDKGEIKDLNKIPIDYNSLVATTDQICKLALQDASTVNTVKAYDNFLNYYTAAPTLIKDEVRTKRNNVAFQEACATNTVESYQYFISTYPVATQLTEAKNKRNALAFERAKATNTIQGYKDFNKTYPDAAELKTSLIRIHELAFVQAQKVNTASAYKKFIDEYPASVQYKQAFDLYEQRLYSEKTRPGDWKSYLDFADDYPSNSFAPVALDSVFSYGIRTNDLKALKFCVDHMAGAKRNKALFYYHDIYTNDGEQSTLDKFYKDYDEYILTAVKERDYELAYLGNKLILDEPFNVKDLSKYREYIEQAAPHEKAFVALQRMIANDIKNKKWPAAAATVKTYAAYFGSNIDKINALIDLLEAKWDNTIKINSVGSGVNTSDGGEYAIVISADNKLLYFCGRDRKDNLGGEDIFVSKMIQGSWGKAKIVEDLSLMFSHDAPSSVSADGNTMLVFQSGDLFYSEKNSLGWDEVISYPKQINSGEWQADAMITSDGNAMIFSCVRDDNYNLNSEDDYYHGDYMYPADIYVSVLDKNKKWGEAVNLGPTINTLYCDRSPFLHPDMKTLYFSSDGHGGLGKLDVFKSTRLADTCWDCWSEPVNMGKEINTFESDWGYKISTDGEKAYFAKRITADGNYDIYWLNLPDHLRPDFVATITGRIMDSENRPVSAEIKWEDLETGKNVGQSKSDPADGTYFIVLPLGKIYGYYVNKEGYYPLANNVDLRNYKQAKEIEEHIILVSYKQMVDEGTAVPINNLFFDFDKSTILPYSIPELKRLARIIKSNNQKIEISGHTDSVGDDQYNQVLSEKRAAAVKDFLVTEGCDPERLVTIGYGRSQPVASNDNDEGRAKNRRVEIRFVG